MRSGFVHLKKKMADHLPSEILEMRAFLEAELPPVAKPPAPVDPPSELVEQRWAVVSFDKTEVSGVSYETALKWVDELYLQGVAGLCVVTDEAAGRVCR